MSERKVLESRGRNGDWDTWRIVWLLEENVNTWRIWSWQDIFTRYVHKHSIGERIKDL